MDATILDLHASSVCPSQIYYTNLLCFCLRPEDKSGCGNKPTPPMHARCARKTRMSFEKVTFYSLEEAIGSMSKSLECTTNQPNLPNMNIHRKVGSKEELVALDSTKRRGDHG